MRTTALRTDTSAEEHTRQGSICIRWIPGEERALGAGKIRVVAGNRREGAAFCPVRASLLTRDAMATLDDVERWSTTY